MKLINQSIQEKYSPAGTKKPQAIITTNQRVGNLLNHISFNVWAKD